MKIFLYTCILFILTGNCVFCAHKHKEKEYQNYWCKKQNGVMEYKNFDNTRIDCLTQEYAIEFDFAEKWAESIGQSLYYSYLTNKKAGIVLISENEKKDTPFINRASILSKKYGIKLWVITSPDM